MPADDSVVVHVFVVFDCSRDREVDVADFVVHDGNEVDAGDFGYDG